MSTVVRGPDGRIKLYCKGADTVILERLGPNQPYTDRTVAHLEVREGAMRPARAHALFPGICDRGPPDIMYRIPGYSRRGIPTVVGHLRPGRSDDQWSW